MAKYIYPTQHITNIRASIEEKKKTSQSKVWENKILKNVRSDLKSYIKNNRENGNKCAYCLKDFYNEHQMSIDVEHILPKGDFPQYTFTLKNLTIACKRCNLQIKGTDKSFLSDDFNSKRPFRSRYYKFTHPVIDKNSLKLFDVHFNGYHIIKYKHANEKSKYTYDYFKLKEIEIDTINFAQGVNPVIDFLSQYRQ